MEIIIIILLILLNGLFAMSEIALISARRSNLTARAKQGDLRQNYTATTMLANSEFVALLKQANTWEENT